MVFKLRGTTRKKLAASVKKMKKLGWKRAAGAIQTRRAKDGHKYYQVSLVRQKRRKAAKKRRRR